MGNLTDPPDALYTLDEDDPARPPDEEQPADLRDEIESESGDLRPGASGDTPLGTTHEPEGGPYPLPDRLERPHVAQPPGTPQPTLDPSLSRPIDRRQAGIDPESSGYEPEG